MGLFSGGGGTLDGDWLGVGGGGFSFVAEIG